MLHFTTNSPIEDRAAFAKRLSLIVEAAESPEIPYTPNHGDESFWTLDSGNNWKLRFESPTQFTVWYRYHSMVTYEAALGTWIAVRMGYPLPSIT